MRKRISQVSGRFLLALCIVGTLAGAASSQTLKTWMPGPNGNANWGDDSNWNPPGVPTSANDVTIPPNSGEILTPPPPAFIEIHGLVIQPSTGPTADDTVLRGNPRVRIVFGPHSGTPPGDITVGSHCKILGGGGADGVAGPPLGPPAPPGSIAPGSGTDATAGGDVELVSEEPDPGDITNNGEIGGKKGGEGPGGAEARPGGHLVIKCHKLMNDNGKIHDGAGGGKQGVRGKCATGGGRENGGVDITTTRTGSLAGDLEARPAGLYTGGAGFGPNNLPNGNQRGVTVNGKPFIFTPGKPVKGRHISWRSDSSLDFSGAQAGALITNGGTIRIDASILMLTGIAAGTQVFEAADVCLAGAVLLDPGVTLQSLCGSAAVHQGGNCASAGSSSLFGPETFDDAVTGPPPGWNALTLQGTTGFRFDNPTNLPLHPNFGCHAAVLNSALNGPGPLLAVLDTPPVSVAGLTGALVLEWEQWYQPCMCGPGSAQAVIVADGVPMPFWNALAPTPPFEFKSFDLSFLPPATQVVSVRFQMQASTNNPPSIWAIDNVAFRIPLPTLPGQAPQPGAAVLDVDTARNANNAPVSSGQPGPFFTDIQVGDTVTFTVLGPPNQTVTFGSGFLMPGTLTLAPWGQLDLDPLSLLVLTPSFPLDPFGTFNLPITIPPPLAGLTLGLQAAVTSPATGLALSNAVEVRFGP